MAGGSGAATKGKLRRRRRLKSERTRRRIGRPDQRARGRNDGAPSRSNGHALERHSLVPLRPRRSSSRCDVRLRPAVSLSRGPGTYVPGHATLILQGRVLQCPHSRSIPLLASELMPRARPVSLQSDLFAMLPPGLAFREDFVSPPEEADLLAHASSLDFKPFQFQGWEG